MEKTQDIYLTEILIPFTLVIFVIAVGVILLYLQYKKSIIQKEYEKVTLKSAQQAELLKAVLITQEDERKRIAADIHDEVGAAISIIKMNLTLLDQKLKTENAASIYHSKSIQNLISLSDNAISSVRNISHQLMPPQLEVFGLIKTLESVQNTINKTGKLTIEISVTDSSQTDIPRPMTLHLYRIIMELINNTIRHAQAKSIFIRFNFEPKVLKVTYNDDGIGIIKNLNSEFSGKGFQTIQTRIGVLGGIVNYPNTADKPGFMATLEIPYMR